MTIDVRQEFAGSLRFRLTFPDGKREYVRGEKWTRRLASEALDLCQYVYKDAKNRRYAPNRPLPLTGPNRQNYG